jgi:hypothetical protein
MANKTKNVSKSISHLCNHELFFQSQLYQSMHQNRTHPHEHININPKIVAVTKSIEQLQ